MTAKQITKINNLLNSKTGLELIIYLQEERLLPRELKCETCGNFMSVNKYKKVSDGFAWRCAKKSCLSFKKYVSIRKNSFFSGFKASFQEILNILFLYACRVQKFSIVLMLPKCEPTIRKVIDKLIRKIPECDFSQNKLGGLGKIVQIDETMMNYKCKSHRGRSSENRTDSLCMVETDGKITRAFAVVIPNKKAETILPFIVNQVCAGSVIHTDEHASYRRLNSLGFQHGTVCHKFEFVNRESGVHTQSIESFHNEMKIEIKRRKGVLTSKRSIFLKEFCFYFNNRLEFLESILNLLKLN